MKKVKLILAACAALFLTACGDGSKRISKADLGDKWNLKDVDSGILTIVGNCALVFVADNGQTYSVNGVAKQSTDYPHLEELIVADASGLLSNPLIDEGKELIEGCE